MEQVSAPAILCCPICHGSGMWARGIEDVECHLCNGTGRVPGNVRQGNDAMPHISSVRAAKGHKKGAH